MLNISGSMHLTKVMKSYKKISFKKKFNFYLWNCAHVDDMSSPASPKLAFSLAGETWSFNCDHRTIFVVTQTQILKTGA